MGRVLFSVSVGRREGGSNSLPGGTPGSWVHAGATMPRLAARASEDLDAAEEEVEVLRVVHVRHRLHEVVVPRAPGNRPCPPAAVGCVPLTWLPRRRLRGRGRVACRAASLEIGTDRRNFGRDRPEAVESRHWGPSLVEAAPQVVKLGQDDNETPTSATRREA